MNHHFADLAGLPGLYELARSAAPLFSSEESDGAAVAARLRSTLGLLPPPARVEPEVVQTWTADGVDGTELRWDVGFGAPSVGWLLRPAGEDRPLPGVVALHCHGGVKYYGKEKIADGPTPAPEGVQAVREELYEGAAYASDLARRGYAVLVPDAFGWGSRRIQLEDMPEKVRATGDLTVAERVAAEGDLDEAARYDCYSGPLEDAMAKLLGLLGTSWGGIVAREDLIAIDILASRRDVLDGAVAVVGLSGGGARAALATALSENVRAAAIIAMMSTLEQVLDGHVHQHTWMFLNPGIGRVADWPDIAAVSRPRPLLVGYAEQDELFSAEGMHAADARLRDLYRSARADDAYRGVFFDAAHSFPRRVQHQVADFLAQALPR